MLLSFSVQNFMSFKQTQSLNMTAGKYKKHTNHLNTVCGRNVLATAGIYGANASGKSNFCKAISFSRDIATGRNPRINSSKLYFRIDGQGQNQPGVFEYRIAMNEKSYDYGFAINYRSGRIVSEWLVRIEGKKENCLFERNHEDDECMIEGSFGKLAFFDNFKGDISEPLSRKTILSQISYYAKKSSEWMMEIKAVFDWFERLCVIMPGTRYLRRNEVAGENEIREFFERELLDFDTGILGLKNGAETFDFDEWKMPDDFKEEVINEVGKHRFMADGVEGNIELSQTEEGDVIYQKVLMDHGNTDDLFEMCDESDGTRRLFDFIPMLRKRPESCVFVVDELDRSMHTNLVAAFLERFFKYHENDRSQIIFTTHDTNIMDLDLLRQDEIWFTERNSDHATEIYSLDKYKVRFDKVINQDYLIGRFGAIPRILAEFQEE